jgi:fibronectin-binding autotransporter adhesin
MKTRPHPHQPNLYQRTNFPGRIALAGMLCSLLGAAGLQAAVKTWDGSSSGNWGTAANWTGGVAPVNGDDLVFPAGAANLVNTNNYSSLKLNSITFTGSGYTLRGNALTVTNGVSGQQAAGANTMENIITLGAAQTFDCTTAGASQTLSGNVTNAGFMLTVSGSGSVYLSGSISGAGGVTKNGTGILDLGGSQANTYAGATVVNDGVVWLGKPAGGDGAIPGSGLMIGDGVGVAYSAVVRTHAATSGQIAPMPITINADGQLDINGTTETIGTSLTLNDGNVDTAGGTLYLSPNSTITVSSTPTISGNLNVGSGTCTIQGTGYLYLYADVSGSASIVKNGSVSLLLYGANTFSGSLTANDSGYLYLADSLALGGTNSGTILNDSTHLYLLADYSITNEALTLNSTYSPTIYVYSGSTNTWSSTNFTLLADATIQVATNGALELVGPILGTGGITKYGPGRLRYSGAVNNTYSGATLVNEGLLELNKSSGWSIGYGSLTIGDGTGGSHADIVRYTGTSSSELNTLVPITVNSSGLLDLNNHSDGVNGSLTLNDGDVQTGTGTLSLDYAPRTITVSNSPSISGRLSVGSGTCTIQGTGYLYLYADVSGSANIVKNDSVALLLYGANTFTGTLTANTGGYIYALNNLALGATNGGTIINDNSMLVMNNVAITNEALTMNSSSSAAIEVLGSDTNIWAGPVSLSRDTYVLVATNTVLDVIGPVSGVGGITKSWPGTLRYSGNTANDYGGVTAVNEGQLELNKTVNSGAIPYAGLVIGDGTGTDTVRCLRAYQLWSYGKPVRVNNSGVFDLNGFNETAFPLTLEGGEITTGAGQLYLSGTVTVLPAATTAAISGNALLYDPVVITNAGHSSSPDLRISASISGGASDDLTKTGAGDVELMVSNSFSGPVTINNGELEIRHSFALGNTNTPVTVNSGGTLHVFGNLTIGEKPLVLNGPGWPGASFVGALAVSDGASSWAGPITNASDSTIYVYGDAGVSRSIDLSGPISGAGGLTKTGLGTNIFSGSTANTYAGTTRVNSGTLVLAKTTWSVAIPADLIVGDGVGGADADVVRVMNNPQINDYATVTVNSSGLIDWSDDGGEAIGSLAGSGHVELGAGSLNTGDNGNSTTFSGLITGAGGELQKSGSGIFTLTGNNTYSGLTYVGNGTLLVNGSQPASWIQVEYPGTLGGTGTVGEILNGSNLKPGASPGCLTSSNLTFTSAGSYYVELNGTTTCSGYDQMNVRGTNKLANATLNVSAAFGLGDAPAEGQELIIINNDGADAITGTFNGLPAGSVISAGGMQFRISYTGGDGNDVSLATVNTPLKEFGIQLTAGNGDGFLNPNECNDLNVVLINKGTNTVTGITASLTSTNPAVVITQPAAAYPDLTVSAIRTNATPFQISTLSSLPCDTNVDLLLTVASATHGAFSIPIRLHSGSPARFENNTPLAILDTNTVTSSIVVSGITAPISKVAVSFYLTHTYDADLDIFLIAPDGTTVALTTDNGSGGDNYGAACGSDVTRAVFDDDAGLSVTAGVAPFVGRFKPEGTLATFNGLSGANVNGTWQLRITDDAYLDVGTLQCWSLMLWPGTCPDGGGNCATCTDTVIAGSITTNDLVQVGRLTRNGTNSSCAAPKTCPGLQPDSILRHYDAYTFYSASNACVSVTLTNDCGLRLFSVAYLGSYDPSNLCANYLGDQGSSGTNNAYSFNVTAGTTFSVVVHEVTANAGCDNYQLVVTGLSCGPPLLNIRPAAPGQVRLNWPTTAAGYVLERTDSIWPTNWSPSATLPVINGGKYAETNDVSGASKFYRLRKTQ